MTHAPGPKREQPGGNSTSKIHGSNPNGVWSPPGPAWLFCPADGPDRYHKAAAAADIVIIDLEDAVAATDKPAAREALLASRLNPESTIVRINVLGTLDAQLGFEALNKTNYRIVMVPKCESAEQVAAVEGSVWLPSLRLPAEC